MPGPPELQPGQFYHIYNRGTDGQDLFYEERNYRHFLRLYAHHVSPVADTYAYCLLRNHFHLLVRVRTVEEQEERHAASGDGVPFCPRDPSLPFGHLFNAYAKAINRAYGRTGSLFQHPFGRVPVTSHAYLQALVVYIHRNPVKRGFVRDPAAWPHSSYGALLSSRPTRLEREEVLAWFDGARSFVACYASPPDEGAIEALVMEA